MPKTAELIVGLKVPDTTSITALQTLHRMGFGKIRDIKRYDYYKFTINGDVKKFQNEICKVDMLVNANKNSFDFSIRKDGTIKILVKSTKIKNFRDAKNSKNFLANINDDGNGILSILKNRLGFGNISKVEKAIMWALLMDGKETKKIADKAAKELLVNEHYQEYLIL